MNIDIVIQLVEHLGIGGLTLFLWWIERAERIKLEQKLEDCLRQKDTRTSRK